jgi:hypothetical protein
VSQRFAVYTAADEPTPLSELLGALERAGTPAEWEPRTARDGGETGWSTGTLVSEATPVLVSHRRVGDAARRELLEFYEHAPPSRLHVLATARRVYIVEADEQSALVERAAAAIAAATGGAIVDDATGDLLDLAAFGVLYGSDEKSG